MNNQPISLALLESAFCEAVLGEPVTLEFAPPSKMIESWDYDAELLARISDTLREANVWVTTYPGKFALVANSEHSDQQGSDLASPNVFRVAVMNGVATVSLVRYEAPENV